MLVLGVVGVSCRRLLWATRRVAVMLGQVVVGWVRWKVVEPPWVQSWLARDSRMLRLGALIQS